MTLASLSLKLAVVRSVSMKMIKDVEKESIVGGVDNYKKSVPHIQCWSSTSLIMRIALGMTWE